MAQQVYAFGAPVAEFGKIKITSVQNSFFTECQKVTFVKP
jgi:hypothetical protein